MVAYQGFFSVSCVSIKCDVSPTFELKMALLYITAQRRCGPGRVFTAMWPYLAIIFQGLYALFSCLSFFSFSSPEEHLFGSSTLAYVPKWLCGMRAACCGCRKDTSRPLKQTTSADSDGVLSGGDSGSEKLVWVRGRTAVLHPYPYSLPFLFLFPLSVLSLSISFFLSLPFQLFLFFSLSL